MGDEKKSKKQGAALFFPFNSFEKLPENNDWELFPRGVIQDTEISERTTHFTDQNPANAYLTSLERHIVLPLELPKFSPTQTQSVESNPIMSKENYQRVLRILNHYQFSEKDSNKLLRSVSDIDSLFIFLIRYPELRPLLSYGILRDQLIDLVIKKDRQDLVDIFEFLTKKFNMVREKLYQSGINAIIVINVLNSYDGLVKLNAIMNYYVSTPDKKSLYDLGFSYKDLKKMFFCNKKIKILYDCCQQIPKESLDKNKNQLRKYLFDIVFSKKPDELDIAWLISHITVTFPKLFDSKPVQPPVSSSIPSPFSVSGLTNSQPDYHLSLIDGHLSQLLPSLAKAREDYIASTLALQRFQQQRVYSLSTSTPYLTTAESSFTFSSTIPIGMPPLTTDSKLCSVPSGISSFNLNKYYYGTSQSPGFLQSLGFQFDELNTLFHYPYGETVINIFWDCCQKLQINSLLSDKLRSRIVEIMITYPLEELEDKLLRKLNFVISKKNKREGDNKQQIADPDNCSMPTNKDLLTQGLQFNFFKSTSSETPAPKRKRKKPADAPVDNYDGSKNSRPVVTLE